MGDFLSGFFWSLGRWQQPSPGLPHEYNYSVGHVQKMSKRKHSKDYEEMMKVVRKKTSTD
jgi:hypothetical protein